MKARATVEEHRQFVAWKEAAEETELRATMHWTGDSGRLADLNVFFVHLPGGRNANSKPRLRPLDRRPTHLATAVIAEDRAEVSRARPLR
jgi:hypothetical protein